MDVIYPRGKYATTPTNLTDTSETTVYTCNAIAAFVTQIWCADDAGAARTITVQATLQSTQYMLVSGAAIPANDALELPFKPLVLVNGDTIEATASAGGVHVMVNCIEETERSH